MQGTDFCHNFRSLRQTRKLHVRRQPANNLTLIGILSKESGQAWTSDPQELNPGLFLKPVKKNGGWQHSTEKESKIAQPLHLTDGSFLEMLLWVTLVSSCHSCLHCEPYFPHPPQVPQASGLSLFLKLYHLPV